VAAYLFYSLPQALYWVLPFSVCLGLLAAQASLARHSETIAMQACSVVRWRIYVPYLAVGLLATVMMGWLTVSAYPKAQHQAERIENVYIRQRDVQGNFTLSGGRFKVGDTIYHVKHLDIAAGRIDGLRCYRLEGGRLVSVIEAPQALFDGKYWQADTYREIEPAAAGLSLNRRHGRLPLPKNPADLVMAQPRPEVLTLAQLRTYMKSLANDHIRSKSLETFYHGRVGYVLAPLIMTVLTLPFALSFPRTGGLGRGIALGLVMGLSYWGLNSGFNVMGSGGQLAPWLAGWLANALALVAGLVMIVRKRATYG
jgi:lipopolysaccharide export system permease protein